MYIGIEVILGVKPMDSDAVAFHAAEPGHLPFGEAANVGIKVVKHLVVGVVGFGQVTGEMLVFQPIFQQTFFGDTVVEETLHLVDHAVLEAAAETGADAFDNHLTVTA